MLRTSEANVNLKGGDARGEAMDTRWQSNFRPVNCADFDRLLRTLEHNMLPINVRCKYQTMKCSTHSKNQEDKTTDGGAIKLSAETKTSTNDGIEPDDIRAGSSSISVSDTTTLEILNDSLFSSSSTSFQHEGENHQHKDGTWPSPSTTPSPPPSPHPNDSAPSVSSFLFTGRENCCDNSLYPQMRQQQRFKPFHAEKWTQRLAELRHFREQNGHCLVPLSYPPNPQLARWVKRQRRQYKLLQDGKASTMTPERALLLEDMGFVWDRRDCAWRERIQELRKYKAEHGDTNVPSRYEPNMALALWVKFQRRQYRLFTDGKPSATSRERIEQLEKEGFLWEATISGGSK